jgi:chemotaxis protein CheD
VGQELIAGMGEYVISHNDDILVALGLGSCIGVAIYDNERKIGGLAHIMLPSCEGGGSDSKSMNKFATIAIPAMIKDMVLKGCKKANMKARIAGGAHMFIDLMDEDTMNIGKRNAEAVIKVLEDEKIPLVAKDIGGHMGRTVRFDLVTGKFMIKTKDGTKEI